MTPQEQLESAVNTLNAHKAELKTIAAQVLAAARAIPTPNVVDSQLHGANLASVAERLAQLAETL